MTDHGCSPGSVWKGALLKVANTGLLLKMRNVLNKQFFQFVVCVVHVPAIDIDVLHFLLHGQFAQQPAFCWKSLYKYQEGKEKKNL